MSGLFIFPEVFITGKIPENRSKELLIADALVGWANCMAGAFPPDNYGEGMSRISNKVGANTPEEFLKLAENLNQ